VSIGFFPAGQRRAVKLAILRRVAEHARRAHRRLGITDRLGDPAGQSRQVGDAERLPEERLAAFEAQRDRFADKGRRVGRIGLDHGADANVEKRVPHVRPRSPPERRSRLIAPHPTRTAVTALS
jgi:hypothetical protein